MSEVRIETLGHRGRRLRVNGADTKVWGPHTWRILDNDQELEEWQKWLLQIDATTDRMWVGWNPLWNGPDSPDYSTRAITRRARQHALWCVENGVVCQVSLLQATSIEASRLSNAHKRHIDAVLSQVGDIGNIILEVANEASSTDFSANGVQYLRAQGLKQLIAVNTNQSGNAKALEDSGADIIAVNPNYRPGTKHVLEADTDHGGRTALNGDKRPFFRAWKDAAFMFRIMLAYDDPDLPGIESHIPGWNKPWNNPNNPNIPPAIKWCQDNIGNQIGERDPVDPPVDPDPDPDPPGEWVDGSSEWVHVFERASYLQSRGKDFDEITEDKKFQALFRKYRKAFLPEESKGGTMSQVPGIAAQVIEQGEFELEGAILTFTADLGGLEELDGVSITVQDGSLVVSVDIQKLAVSFGVDEDTVKQILAALNLLELV